MCAGFFHPHSDNTFLSYVRKRGKTLLLPYVGFSLTIIVFVFIKRVLLHDIDVELFQNLGKDFLLLKGTALGIWFFTGILVAGVFMEIAKRLRVCNWVLLIISILLSLISIKFSSILSFCNISNAMYYFIYYALGYMVFPLLGKEMICRYKKQWSLMGLVAIGLSTIIFIYAQEISSWLAATGGYTLLIKPMVAVVIISGCIRLSFFLKDMAILSKIGQSTLWLCGNEYLIRATLKMVAAVLPIASLLNEWTCLIITFVMLLIGIYIIIPVEKTIINLGRNYT